MWWFSLLLFTLTLAYDEGEYFQYKHSFLPPFSIGSTPYWVPGGSTIINEDFISLTGDVRSQKGHLWNTEPFNEKNWEVRFRFVVGRNGYFGADGFALWYTKERGTEGEAFGNTALFRGLGLMFDTFDNDNSGSHPAIYAVLGDGKTPFDHTNDGEKAQSAHCIVDFRTSAYDPKISHKRAVHAKLTYIEGYLTLAYDIYGGSEWSTCFSVALPLEQGGYFGLTAATGGMTDHHDIVSLSTYSFSSVGVPVVELKGEVKPQGGVVHPVVTSSEEKPNAPAATGTLAVENFMKDVESRQVQFSVQLQSQFVGFAKRLSDLDSATNQALSQVSDGAVQLNNRLVNGKFILETLQKDISALTELVSSLSRDLETIQNIAVDTSQTTEAHYREQADRRQKTEQSLEGHSTGFWIFFIVFQAFFIVNMFYSKKTTDETRKRFA